MFSDAKVGDKYTAIFIDTLSPHIFEVTSVKKKYGIVCGFIKEALLGNTDYGCCFRQKDGSDTDYGGWRLFPLGTTITVNYPEE